MLVWRTDANRVWSHHYPLVYHGPYFKRQVEESKWIPQQAADSNFSQVSAKMPGPFSPSEDGSEVFG